ncbi:MAG: NHL repeat-containing protein [Chloroflexota bacterium]
MRLLKRILAVAVLFLALTLPVSAQEAVTLFGQPNLTSTQSGHSAAGLNFPLGITVDGSGGFYVADRNNHRVLFFANDGDATADRVYGQHGSFDAYTSNYDGVGGSGNPSADSLSMPTVVTLAPDGSIYVTDRDNHRVLHYPEGTTTADRVYGQFGSFVMNPPNNNGIGGSGVPSADNIGVFTLGVIADVGGVFYAADSSNNRVLYFANDGDTTADRVYGQFGAFTTGTLNNDGTGQTGAPSADSLNFPRGMALDETGGLFVADRENNRVLYFASDGDTTADRVYGQFGDFTANLENNDGSGGTGLVSADSLSHPKAIALAPDGGIYIADSINSRILYYALDGDTTADWVYGQADFSSRADNRGGQAGSGTLNQPQSIAVGPDGRLYIADTGNNRVLVVPGHS